MKPSFAIVAMAAIAMTGGAVFVHAAPLPVKTQQKQLKTHTDASADVASLAVPVVQQPVEEQLIARYNPIGAVTHGNSVNEIISHAVNEATSHALSPQSSPTHSRSSSSGSEHFTTPKSSPSGSHYATPESSPPGSPQTRGERPRARIEPSGFPSPWPSLRDARPDHDGTLPYTIESHNVPGVGDPRNRIRLTIGHLDMPKDLAAPESPPRRSWLGGPMNGWPQHPVPSEHTRDWTFRNTRAENLQWYDGPEREPDHWHRVIGVRYLGYNNEVELTRSHTRDENLNHLSFVIQAKNYVDDMQAALDRVLASARAPGDHSEAYARAHLQMAKDSYDHAMRWASDNFPQFPGPRHPPNPPGYQHPPRPLDADPNDPNPGFAYPGISAIGYPKVRTSADELGPVGMPFHRDGPILGMPLYREYAVRGEPWPKTKGWKRVTKQLQIPARIHQLKKPFMTRHDGASASNSHAHTHDGASTSQTATHDAASASAQGNRHGATSRHHHPNPPGSPHSTH